MGSKWDVRQSQRKFHAARRGAPAMEGQAARALAARNGYNVWQGLHPPPRATGIAHIAPARVRAAWNLRLGEHRTARSATCSISEETAVPAAWAAPSPSRPARRMRTGDRNGAKTGAAIQPPPTGASRPSATARNAAASQPMAAPATTATAAAAGSRTTALNACIRATRAIANTPRGRKHSPAPGWAAAVQWGPRTMNGPTRACWAMCATAWPTTPTWMCPM